MSSEETSRVLKGLATSRGVACGPVFLYRGDSSLTVPEYVVPLGGESGELKRLRAALDAAQKDVGELVETLRSRSGRDDVKVFESHLMMLQDPVMVAEAERTIAVGHVNAEASVRQVVDHYRGVFGEMDDPYFRERVRDLDDIERRILKHLAGEDDLPVIDVKDPCVFVAQDLTPSEAVRLPADRILAIVLEGGSPTSHVALLARSLGIPAVTGAVGAATALAPNDRLLVNGTTGELVVNPSDEEVSAFRRASLRSAPTAPEEPGRLADGSGVLVFANIHSGIPLDGVRRSGATGVGLYRSEYLWLNGEREPTEEEQFEAYRAAAEFTKSLSPKATLTLRTLDIGGDKIVRGLTATEANPFLGNRSIRYSLSHPDSFRTQLRAILRASAFGKICILYPLVSCVEELVAAEAHLAAVRKELDDAHVAYDKMTPVGAMIEVPAAALNAAALARHVDFFSVGTNDLIQYTMAADRGNEAVSHLYQPAHPAVLELMRRIFDAARANDIPVGVCGESAGDPVLGPLWAAMGAELLSVAPGYIPPLARVLRKLSRTNLNGYAAAAAALDPQLSGVDAYARLKDWLKVRIPDFDNLLV